MLFLLFFCCTFSSIPLLCLIWLIFKQTPIWIQFNFCFLFPLFSFTCDHRVHIWFRVLCIAFFGRVVSCMCANKWTEDEGSRVKGRRITIPDITGIGLKWKPFNGTWINGMLPQLHILTIFYISHAHMHIKIRALFRVLCCCWCCLPHLTNKKSSRFYYRCWIGLPRSNRWTINH